MGPGTTRQGGGGGRMGSFLHCRQTELEGPKENAPNEEGSSFEASSFEPSTPARLHGEKLPVLPPSPVKPTLEINLKTFEITLPGARDIPSYHLCFEPILLTRETG